MENQLVRVKYKISVENLIQHSEYFLATCNQAVPNIVSTLEQDKRTYLQKFGRVIV